MPGSARRLPNVTETQPERPASEPSARATATDAVWTVPNSISMARIVLIGVFGWLMITGHDLWAIAALVIAGVSDFLDGYLARRWNQVTKLGGILDPTADRLLTIVVVLALAIRGIIPWWLLGILFARDIVMGIALLYARRRGVHVPEVTFVGKAATFALYFFLPLAFLAFDRWDMVHLIAIVGATATAILYWISGVFYVNDIAKRSRVKSRAGASAPGHNA